MSKHYYFEQLSQFIQKKQTFRLLKRGLFTAEYLLAGNTVVEQDSKDVSNDPILDCSIHYTDFKPLAFLELVRLIGTSKIIKNA